MIPLETVAFLSPPAASARAEAEHLLRSLQAALEISGAPREHVLALTFFVDAAELTAYRAASDALGALVRDGFGPEGAPPTSVVAQPPAAGHVALEATLLSGRPIDVTLSRRTCEGHPYTLVASPRGRQVHAGGLASRDDSEDPETQSAEALAAMDAILEREGMTFGHVVRQWNYIEHMLEPGVVGPRDCQRYQVFNDVRTLAYERATFPHGYPAATGIGQATGGVQIEFIAIDAGSAVEIAPLSNPQQVDAHCYSSDVLVGRPARDLAERTPPKFERAKRVAWGAGALVFVSGTASIVGEQSIGVGDPTAQTRTTLGHIEALLEGEMPSYLRAYVKHASDIGAVRTVCQSVCGRTPVTYVQADVCRGELLVEIEGLLVRSSARE